LSNSECDEQYSAELQPGERPFRWLLRIQTSHQHRRLKCLEPPLFLSSVKTDSQYSIVSDIKMDGIHIQNWVNGLQQSRLPGLNFRQYLVRNFTDHIGLYFNTIDLMHMLIYVAIAHAFSIHGYYSFLKVRHIALPLFNNDRLMLALTITWYC